MATSLPPVYDPNEKWMPYRGVFTESELVTIQGNRFYVEFDVVFTTLETKYIKYQMPPLSSGKIVALQQRIFKALNGEAEIEVLWNTTGGTLGAPLVSYNENRNTSNTALMVATPFTVAPSGGDVRESDFVTGTGAGSNSSGDVSPAAGYRIYSPDSDFVLKVTNLHNMDNRIHVSYSWLEVDPERVNNLWD